jgi:ribosomal protein S18 acetylase RimI-like enzyme
MAAAGVNDTSGAACARASAVPQLAGVIDRSIARARRRAAGARLPFDPATALHVPSSSAPPVTIRPAAPADLPAVGRLGALLVRVHHDFDPQRFIAPMPQTEQLYASFLGGQLVQPDVIILVAQRGGEVLGYTYAGVEGNDYMSLRGPAGVLHDIVVDPAHRAQGVGRMLLDATLAELRARGAPRVVLSTAERNEAAQRLFARAGFRRTMIEMTRELDDDAS